MMKSLQKTACALAVLAVTTTSVFAADSVDIKVTGTIKPAACTPTITGGGTIDYGNIGLNTLSATDYTPLPEKQVDFSITCDAPAKIALKATNGRPGTAAGAPDGVGGFGESPVGLFTDATGKGWGVAGLGTAEGKNIGGFGMRLAAGTVKATVNDVEKEVFSITSADGGITWSTSRMGNLQRSDVVGLASWGATSDDKTPVALTTLSGKLGVQAYINKTSELHPTGEIKLDGLSTIELVYL